MTVPFASTEITVKVRLPSIEVGDLATQFINTDRRTRVGLRAGNRIIPCFEHSTRTLRHPMTRDCQ